MYRDALPEAERPAFDAAADAAMAGYAESWRDLCEFAQVHGVPAAAERCLFPGRDVAVIQRRLQEHLDAARKRAA